MYTRFNLLILRILTGLIYLLDLVFFNWVVHTCLALSHRPYHGVRLVLLNHHLAVILPIIIQYLGTFEVALVDHDVVFVEGSNSRWLHFWCFFDLLVLNVKNMSDAASDVDVLVLLNGWSALLLLLLLDLILRDVLREIVVLDVDGVVFRMILLIETIRAARSFRVKNLVLIQHRVLLLFISVVFFLLMLVVDLVEFIVVSFRAFLKLLPHLERPLQFLQLFRVFLILNLT